MKNGIRDSISLGRRLTAVCLREPRERADIGNAGALFAIVIQPLFC
jgi:hypothetical protein